MFGLETTGMSRQAEIALVLQAVKTMSGERDRRAWASSAAKEAPSGVPALQSSVTTSAGRLQPSAATASRGWGRSTTSQP
jgi:hypothetical protein